MYLKTRAVKISEMFSLWNAITKDGTKNTYSNIDENRQLDWNSNQLEWKAAISKTMQGFQLRKGIQKRKL